MTKEKDLGDIDALLAELTSGEATSEDNPEYPLPSEEPVKFSNVDVVILPLGYKGEYPKPSGEGEDSKPRFVDSIAAMKLDLDTAEEADGVLSVPVTVANAAHIYDYDGLKVRKPFDELEAAAFFADGIPITREHPSAGIVTDRSEVLGFLKNPTAEDDLLKGILAITDKNLMADIKSKKLTEVSAGFFCDLDEDKSGELDGKHFDATQKNIFLNHIAVVESGRCSIEEGCGIGLDAKKTPIPAELVDKLTAAIARAKAMKDTSLYDMLKELLKGVSVKKDDKTVDTKALDLVKVKDAFSKIRTERDTFKGKLDEIVKAEHDSLVAELLEEQDSKKKEDLSKLTIDDLQKELDMVKAIKSKHISVPDSSQSSGRKSIDDAYSKMEK